MAIELLSLQEGVNVILASKVLTAILGFGIYIIIIIPLLKLIEKFLLFLVKFTETTADDELADRLNPWAVYFFGTLGLRFAYIYSNLFMGSAETILRVINSIMIFIVFYAAYVFVDVIIEHAGKKVAKKTKSTADDHLITLGQKSVKFLAIIFALLAISSHWGFNVTSVLAGLGIAGIAIGFAVKDSLANIFGGISIILDHTFSVGNKIKIDSGEVGVITDIGIRSTRIRDYDNKEIIIPNGVMANAKIVNYTKPNKKIKFSVHFGVAYGTDVEKVKKVVIASLKKMKNVLPDPLPSVIFKDMGDSSLNFKAMAWVQDYNDEFLTKEEATSVIYVALNKAKIEIPFPQMDVHVKK